MIEVHHLNNSRSQRILWLLEELELPYQIVQYQRDPETNLAPASLAKVHPLGKSPVIRDGDQVLYESGAIVDHIIRHHGGGRLAPPESSPENVRYQQLLHYAEGSAMLPLMLKLYTSRLGDAAAPLAPRIAEEIGRHLGFLEGELGGRDYFLGDDLSGADIQLSFVVQAGRMLHGLSDFPKLAGFRDRIVARPAYERAIEKGGAYAF
jgi:glutathione S-transferase